MANAWDEKLKTFLKKTGEDFKRAGNDIKQEAQKLVKEVKDPESQAKLKDGLKDFGGWAKKTAVEMASLAETGFKKAEGSFRQAAENWTPAAGGEPSGAEATAGEAAPAPTATPPSGPPEMPTPSAPPPPAAAKKTVGRKKPSSAAAKPKAGAKKTIGKKSGPPSGGG